MNSAPWWLTIILPIVTLFLGSWLQAWQARKQAEHDRALRHDEIEAQAQERHAEREHELAKMEVVESHDRDRATAAQEQTAQQQQREAVAEALRASTHLLFLIRRAVTDRNEGDYLPVVVSESAVADFTGAVARARVFVDRTNESEFADATEDVLDMITELRQEVPWRPDQLDERVAALQRFCYWMARVN